MTPRSRLLAAALVATLSMSLLPAGASAASGFSDTDGHMFAAEVDALSAAGITKGCNPLANTKFCPDARVTRGQMAAFLVRALKLPAGKATFADTKGSVFAADVAALADAGITRGCNPPANTKFCPDDYVTRGQMAAFLTRALGLKPGSASFSDTKGHVFAADIAALADAGITKGCNPPANTKFCPDDYVTRGQMAAFLVRALDLPVSSGGGGGNNGGTPKVTAWWTKTQYRGLSCPVDFAAITPKPNTWAHDYWGSLEMNTWAEFKDWAMRIPRDGGPFYAWVGSQPAYESQIDNVIRAGKAEIGETFTFLSNANEDVGYAFHETLHDVQHFGTGIGKDLVTGVKKGCAGAGGDKVGGSANSGIGIPQRAIAAAARAVAKEQNLNIIDKIEVYLEAPITADQGLDSIIREMNAYVLQGLLVDSFDADPVGATDGAWPHMLFAELYLLEVEENHPDQWKALKEYGWADVFASAWAMAEGAWPTAVADAGERAGLARHHSAVFGSSRYGVIKRFTDGKVGTAPPPAP